jgi:hypothetical protein
MMQREADQYQPGEGEEYRDGGCPKHRLCPQSHLLLGIQIAYIVLIAPLALGGAFLSYQIAYRGLNLIESGRKVLGASIFVLVIALAPPLVGLYLALGFNLAYGPWRLNFLSY